MCRLKLQQVRKVYGATTALASGDLMLEAGEIHVLIGANGSGKSTLCKVVAGSVKPDSGLFELAGEPVSLNSPKDARHLGVCLFYQELSLSGHLSVADNICLNALPSKAGVLIDQDALEAKAQRYIDQFSDVVGDGFGIDVPVAKLRPDQKQLVEIMKTLASEADILIFDEPTSALDRSQVERFFSILRGLKEQGRSIIFISHRMDEIFEIGDRITVIRDGATVSSRRVSETNHATIIEDMIGEQAANKGMQNGRGNEVDSRDKPICLSVSHLKSDRLKDVSFELAEGEILGLGGLHGQGQSHMLRALFGAQTHQTGKLLVGEKPVRIRNPRAAIRQGFAYVSGDRVKDGVITGRSIMENVSPIHFFKDKKILALPSALSDVVGKALAALSTKYSSLSASIGSLSGGNQQKAVIARWLTNPPNILLLDDPTKGIDLKAKEELFILVRRLADEGMAIILYSSEDAELLAHSDRILVFNNGEVSRELIGDEKTRFNLYQAAYAGGETC